MQSYQLLFVALVLKWDESSSFLVGRVQKFWKVLLLNDKKKIIARSIENYMVRELLQNKSEKSHLLWWRGS